MNFPFDSRELRAFAALAHCGSFTKVAKELHISQSAVSHAMKALEEDAGCRLLDRVGKKLALTQAGEQLLSHTEKILTEMEAARVSLAHLGKWGQSRLRIGASSTACHYFLPHVLSEFKENFPQCLISLGSGDSEEAMELLRNNQIDLALVLQPRHETEFEFHPLFTDEMFFLIAPSHPWADGGVVRAEIPKQHYILYHKTSYTFRLVEEYFRREQMVLNTVMELGSMEAIKELVKLGLGVCILARWIAEKELLEKSLLALPLGKRKLKRTWVIACRKDRRLGMAEEMFIRLCHSFAESIGVTAPSEG